MAARTDKNRGPYIEDELYEKLVRESEATKISIKQIVHIALTNYFSGSDLSSKDQVLLKLLSRIDGRLNVIERDSQCQGELIDKFAKVTFSLLPKLDESLKGQGAALGELRYAKYRQLVKEAILEDSSLLDDLGRNFIPTADDYDKVA